MSEKKHYHPLSLVIHLLNGIKGWIFPLFWIFFNWKRESIWFIFGLLVLIMGTAVVSYVTHFYQLTSDRLIIYSGIFNKRETIIPYERIQTIKQQQWFFFKPFHVVRLAIETAGGDHNEAEAVLPAVSEDVLQLLEQQRANPAVIQEETPRQYQITNGQIFLFAVTNLSIFAAAFVVAEFVEELLPAAWTNWLWTVTESRSGSGWVMLVLFLIGAIFLLSLFSIAKSFVLYYRFQVSREQDQLTLEHGLFERKTQKIPLHKIQGLKIHQKALRKLFGLVSVELLLAGSQEGEDAQLLLLPIIGEDQVYSMLDFLLPEQKFAAPAINYVSRKYLWYFVRLPLLFGLPAMLALFIIQPWLSAIAGVILLGLLLNAWLSSRYQGYEIQGTSRLCLQKYFLLTKTQTFVERSKIQAFHEKTSRGLYPKKIGHIQLNIAAGDFTSEATLRYFDWENVQTLTHFYRQK